MRGKRLITLLLALVLLPCPALADSGDETPGEAEARWQEERTALLTQQLLRFGGYTNEADARARAEAFRIDPAKPMLALTFDDGPVMGVTDRILDILETYDARATFFVCGWRIHRAPELLKRALGEGCELGNHTYNHENLSELNARQIFTTVKATNTAIERETGVTPRLLRPPGGVLGSSHRTARRLSMAVVLWSQSGNVKLTNPDEIVSTVFCQPVNGRVLADGDIVLLHDTHDYMVEAVEKLVPKLIDAGYQLVTVSELLHYAECGFIPGATYRSRFLGSHIPKD